MLKIHSQLERALRYETQYGNGRDNESGKPPIDGVREARILAAQSPVQQTVSKLSTKKKNG